LPGPGRMAAATSFCFLLLGIALTQARRRRGRPVDAATLAVMACSFLALLGYLYGLRPSVGYIMALPTALSFVVAGFMTLAVARRSTVRDLLVSRDAGGILLRRFAPVVFLLFPLLGWLRL